VGGAPGSSTDPDRLLISSGTARKPACRGCSKILADVLAHAKLPERRVANLALSDRARIQVMRSRPVPRGPPSRCFSPAIYGSQPVMRSDSVPEEVATFGRSASARCNGGPCRPEPARPRLVVARHQMPTVRSLRSMPPSSAGRCAVQAVSCWPPTPSLKPGPIELVTARLGAVVDALGPPAVRSTHPTFPSLQPVPMLNFGGYVSSADREHPRDQG